MSKYDFFANRKHTAKTDTPTPEVKQDTTHKEGEPNAQTQKGKTDASGETAGGKSGESNSK